MSKCLILLCGPPACLKTTLIRILRCLLSPRRSSDELQNLCLNKLRRILQHPLDENLSCFFLSFDQLFVDYEEEILVHDSQWKAYRTLIADAIEERLLPNATLPSATSLPFGSALLDRLTRSLSECSRPPSLWFIEDNFYYSSMRNRYRQIAQRAQIGFAAIHLVADMAVARHRNARRDSAQRVSDRSLENIFSKYELSPTDLTLDTTRSGLTVEHLDEVLQRIDRARREPERLVDLEDERRRATEINRENFLYQLDQKLRKFVSTHLQKIFATKEKFSTSQAKKLYAEMINEKRQTFFQLIKQGDLSDSGDELEIRFEQFISQ